MDIHILKAQWEFFGLRAPVFSWLVSAGIIVYGLSILLWQFRESKIRQGALSFADKKLKALQRKHSALRGRRHGISRSFLTDIDGILHDLPLLRNAWQTISSSLVGAVDKNGEECFWIGEDVGAVFNETMTAENRDYRNATAVITGVGLLATFLAILVALLDVRLTNNRIQGLDLLIQGLSGKFLSSVVAVACATTLVFFEKALFYPVKARVLALCATLREVLPKLTPAQILLDGRREILDRLDSFKNRDAGLVESMGESLARSIEPALERMSAAFKESLGGATADQFKQMSEVLAGSALMMEQMNSRLAMTGEVLTNMAETARCTAADETASRRTHVEQMSGAVDDLMGKLQVRTGESVGAMEKAMAALALDMTCKMTEASNNMAAAVEKVSEASTGGAAKVIEQAGALIAKNGELLSALLERHSAEMSKMDDLRGTLDSTLTQFTDAIGRYSETTEGLSGLAVEVNKSIASLAGITRAVAESQETAGRLLTSSSGQIERLQGYAADQEEAWRRMQTSMADYQKMFQIVEAQANELLSQIAHHLGGYSSVTEKHFSLLATTADNFISQAAGRLSGSIDELGEQLDVLHGAMSKMASVSRSVR